MRTTLLRSFCLAAVLALSGCQATVYRALESVGIEKRDVLVNRVSAARDSQTEAKEQFASALEQFRSVVRVDAGDLERTYDKLNSEYERSRESAKEVSERIDTVDEVAGDLFDEWEDELDNYSNDRLRRDSQRLLNDTKKRYATLLRAMRQAEKSMDPVLDVFEDQVLTLKHNLNAQAIGSLKRELGSIEKQTSSLIAQMERSIREADEFIEGMKNNAG